MRENEVKLHFLESTQEKDQKYKIGKSIDISSQIEVYKTIKNFINKKIKIPSKNFAYVNKKHSYSQYCEKVTKSFI